jgi:DNA polymerase I-like protein with 3'-5' exonuclease and polymerase domains
LDGFLKEISEDNRLHCFFNLNTVSSYRSSSSYINFQNIPKRDEDAQRITRSGLFPFPGHRFEDFDFKSIEVGISVCYHKDRNMLAYVTDESSDMHKDQAKEIFIRDESEYKNPKMKKLYKLERYLAKNGFVFAQFYGDYFVNCAISIWERMDEESRKHLREFGIRNLEDFTEHMESVEAKFWNKRFPDYAQWKEDNWNWYKKKGYVEYYTGFRAGGIMRKNQVNNLAIQGTAFHVNLETIDYTMRRIKRWSTKPVGQIHDSIVFSNDPGYSEDLDMVMSKALGHVADKWGSWLIVPLQVEKEVGEVDQPWIGLENVKKIYAS